MAVAYKPDPLPEWDGLYIGGYHKCLHLASGDWFGFQSSKSGHLKHIIMCDITGHGVQAALVVSACKVLLGNLRAMNPEIFETTNFNTEFMKILRFHSILQITLVQVRPYGA